MIQPFETVVEVVPKLGDLYASQTLVQPAQPTLFDLIDANHDGVITRQELAAAGGSTSAAQASTEFQQQTAVLHSGPFQNMPPSEPMMNAGPTEPVMNRPSQLSDGSTSQSFSQGLLQGTMQVVPTTQMLTQTQVLQPMQAVQDQQMDLLSVTPWGYSVNHMGR